MMTVLVATSKSLDKPFRPSEPACTGTLYTPEGERHSGESVQTAHDHLRTSPALSQTQYEAFSKVFNPSSARQGRARYYRCVLPTNEIHVTPLGKPSARPSSRGIKRIVGPVRGATNAPCGPLWYMVLLCSAVPFRLSLGSVLPNPGTTLLSTLVEGWYSSASLTICTISFEQLLTYLCSTYDVRVFVVSWNALTKHIRPSNGDITSLQFNGIEVLKQL